MLKKRKKSKLEKEIEDTYEIGPDSDLPIHEKFVKEKDILSIKKKKKK